MTRTLALALITILATSPAFSGGIRKCKDPATGKVIYTDKLCPGQAKQERLEIHDNSVGSLPAHLVQPLSATRSDVRQRSVGPRKQKAPTTSGTGTSPLNRSHY
jgi:hypothetical protein